MKPSFQPIANTYCVSGYLLSAVDKVKLPPSVHFFCTIEEPLKLEPDGIRLWPNTEGLTEEIHILY